MKCPALCRLYDQKLPGLKIYLRDFSFLLGRCEEGVKHESGCGFKCQNIYKFSTTYLKSVHSNAETAQA